MINNLGKGVQRNSGNWVIIVRLQQLAVQRFIFVWQLYRIAPRMNWLKSREESRQQMLDNRRTLLQSQGQLLLEMDKLAQLKNMEQLELFLRHIRLQGAILVAGKLKKLQDLAQERPEVLRRRLTDKNAETRWMAVQVVGIHRYPYQADLVALLSDPDNSVRQAARQALVRVSRGNDFGPAIKAGQSEREKAIGRWKHWWSLQDSNPRRQLLRLTDQ